MECKYFTQVKDKKPGKGRLSPDCANGKNCFMRQLGDNSHSFFGQLDVKGTQEEIEGQRANDQAMGRRLCYLRQRELL